MGYHVYFQGWHQMVWDTLIHWAELRISRMRTRKKRTKATNFLWHVIFTVFGTYLNRIGHLCFVQINWLWLLCDLSYISSEAFCAVTHTYIYVYPITNSMPESEPLITRNHQWHHVYPYHVVRVMSVSTFYDSTCL